ncbi:MAG TPA: sulfite exporter TauE/SafE family protein [Kineosporiaceae bacterium]
MNVVLETALVFLAGVGAGTINTVVGSGTLITFPVLLSVGLSPLTANVTNTLGLVPGSFTGAYGYRDQLHGQRRLVLRLGSASLIGALIGAALLLVLPPGAFKAIVPVLVALALVLVVAGPAINRRLARDGSDPASGPSRRLWGATVGAGAYGGYFGAAQGVLLMGLLGALHGGDVQRNNAVKNVLAGTANLVAAVVFVIVAQPDWLGVALVAAGSTLGGVIGARVGRRLSPRLLRGLIVVVGLVAIVKVLMS